MGDHKIFIVLRYCKHLHFWGYYKTAALWGILQDCCIMGDTTRLLHYKTQFSASVTGFYIICLYIMLGHYVGAVMDTMWTS